MIDVLLPAEPTDGYLWVAVADVTGNLSTFCRTSAARTRRSRSSARSTAAIRRIRVAYSLAEARRRPEQPAFTVDETFGKSAGHRLPHRPAAVRPLRPTTETIASFTEDLGRVLQAGQVRILAIATQLIDLRG